MGEIPFTLMNRNVSNQVPLGYDRVPLLGFQARNAGSTELSTWCGRCMDVQGVLRTHHGLGQGIGVTDPISIQCMSHEAKVVFSMCIEAQIHVTPLNLHGIHSLQSLRRQVHERHGDYV